MTLLAALLAPLLRGASLAALCAGLADAWAVALGGGTGAHALAIGALLIALGWGAAHVGSGKPPARASFLWLPLAAVALPMFSAWAPWSGLFGAVTLLPMRVLGARLSAFLAVADQPGTILGAQTLGAALGLAATLANGLGIGGIALSAALCGALTVGAPQPARADDSMGEPPWSRVAQRLTGLLLGAGVVSAYALLAPLLRVHDASDASADTLALLTVALIALLGWWTLGGLLAEHRAGPVLLALCCAAAAVILPRAVDNWIGFSAPLPFDRLLRQDWLIDFWSSDTPRLSELHPFYVPLLCAVGAGLPALLLGATLRGWLGRASDGTLRLAPLLAGAGLALVVVSLPWAEQDAAPTILAVGGASLLLLAAIGVLTCADGKLGPRAAVASLLLAAGAAFLRPPAAAQPPFPLQDVEEWTVSAGADGAPLSAFARGAIWRVVGKGGGDARVEHLARGRNLLTPPLDEDGAWTREIELALILRPQARSLLMAGAPHPASLRAAARGGVTAATLAVEDAALRLLRARDPGGYGLALARADSVAIAGGAYDLVLLRSQALWDEDLPLLRASLAAQAARRLAPGGRCVLAIGPEQAVPGLLPGLLAAWREIFPSCALYVAPDGLRGARLLLAAAGEGDAEWPPALESLRVAEDRLAALAADAARARLAPPMPRARAALATTVWRLADELRSVRRAGAVLEELAGPVADGEAPSLLRAYALHYASQRYSAHDDALAPGPEAIEVEPAALIDLGRLARAHPESAWLRATWSDVAGTLAAKREVGLLEEHARPLREELGWREPGLTLALARAAAELLDEEEARALIAEVLERSPGDPAALALLEAMERGLAPDAHAGHGHD